MKRYDFELGDPGESASMVESVDGDYVEHDVIIQELAEKLFNTNGWLPYHEPSVKGLEQALLKILGK